MTLKSLRAVAVEEIYKTVSLAITKFEKNQG